MGQPSSSRTRPSSSITAPSRCGQAALGQVPAHGADHAAGQLMLQIGRIEPLRPTDGQALGLGQPREIPADFRQRLIVNAHAVAERAQICDHPFGRRIRGAVGSRARGALQRTHTVLRRIHIGVLGQPDGAMGVQFQRLGADRRP